MTFKKKARSTAETNVQIDSPQATQTNITVASPKSTRQADVQTEDEQAAVATPDPNDITDISTKPPLDEMEISINDNVLVINGNTDTATTLPDLAANDLLIEDTYIKVAGQTFAQLNKETKYEIKIEGDIKSITTKTNVQVAVTINGNVLNDVAANYTTVTKDVAGYVTGDYNHVHGDIANDLTGNYNSISGNVNASVTGNYNQIQGNISNNLTGNYNEISGSIDGTIIGESNTYRK